MTDSGRPAPLSATVSAQMKRMPRASSGPELAIRRELHRRGLRFRVNYSKLPGRPDIAFTRARIAIFVDGCFWHSCPEHGILPKNNREWWHAKLARNVERDTEKDALLRELGWTVLHFWEHENPLDVAALVEQAWRSRLRCVNTANAADMSDPWCEILEHDDHGGGGCAR